MSAPYRDPQTEQAIADARARPQNDDRYSDEADMARNAEGPFDDRPDVMEQAAARLHADCCADGKFNGVFPVDEPQPRTVLIGESHEAYLEFTAAAQALEAHQRAATPVLERYKTALGKLSAIAARGA